MCRIFGGKYLSDLKFSIELVNEMRDTLKMGGPDVGASYFDQDIFITHRRLSIIDLSDYGNQPLEWNNLVISFNGEIYNYLDLKRELIKIGYQFSTNSDTEVLLKSYHAWGIDCLEKLRGMFAFCIYDKNSGDLFLFRDRFGVKPLYWFIDSHVFLFASEIKPFKNYKNFNGEINPIAVSEYLSHGYVSENRSIYSQVNKLLPGHYLHFSKENVISIYSFWTAQDVYSRSRQCNLEYSKAELTLEGLLRSSFNLRMVADVPVGIFLSGGIDSSLVTTLLKQDHYNLMTFSIGFDDKKYDESVFASTIAKYLGTQHHALKCSEQDFQEIFYQLPYIYDEPFADASSIPTVLLSKFTKQFVKVALSGDGGDELFGGYSKYKFVYEHNNLTQLPNWLKKLIIECLNFIDPIKFESFLKYFGLTGYTQVDSKFHKFKDSFRANNLNDLIESLSSSVPNDNFTRVKIKNPTKKFNSNTHLKDVIGYFGLYDINNFLPSSVLTKVDRASMHFALEAREPFLDPEILQFAFSLPQNFKINKGKTKYILRNILSKYLPQELFDRPKAGFSIPVIKWMMGVYAPLLDEMMRNKYFFEVYNLNYAYINDAYSNFRKNKHVINPLFFWHLLCLFNWHNTQGL